MCNSFDVIWMHCICAWSPSETIRSDKWLDVDFAKIVQISDGLLLCLLRSIWCTTSRVVMV